MLYGPSRTPLSTRYRRSPVGTRTSGSDRSCRSSVVNAPVGSRPTSGHEVGCYGRRVDKRTLIGFAACTALLGACQKDVPRSQMPHLSTLCVEHSRWNDLLGSMRQFAASKGLEFHGGIERDPENKPLFNAYIARGYSYWFGDDLDLWLVSNPFRGGEMDLNGIAKQPWSAQDTNTANALIAAIKPLQCGATLNGS